MVLHTLNFSFVYMLLLWQVNNYKTYQVINPFINRSYALTPSTDFKPIIFELICVNLSAEISKTTKLTVTSTPLRSSVEAGETYSW